MEQNNKPKENNKPKKLYSIDDTGQDFQNSLNRFKGLDDVSTQSIYGSDPKLSQETDNELDEVRKVIKKASSPFKSTTGDNMIEFFTVLANNLNKGRKKKIDHGFEFSKMLDQYSNYSIDSFLNSEADRLQRYEDYRTIYTNIPELSQCLHTYVDNIMSPDDYTKTMFNFFIKEKSMASIETEDDSFNIRKNLEIIMENYNIEDLTKKILTESLKIGDQFVTTIDLNKKLDTIINESSKTLSTNDIQLTDEEFKLMEEVLHNNKISQPVLNENASLFEKNEYNAKLNSYNAKKEDMKNFIRDKINSNFIIETKDALIKDNKDLINSYNIFNENIEVLNNQDDVNKQLTKKKTKKRIKVHGSIVKNIEPERTVKLELDDMVYGYYYFYDDQMSYGSNVDRPTTGNNLFGNVKTNNVSLYNGVDNKEDEKTSAATNEKNRMIADIFVKNIAAKIDSRFINKYEDFKFLIYNLLNRNYITEKQIRVVYFGPSEVIHFGNGEGVYYNSIYKNILFIAKLYLATLISNLMLKLVRSPEKRAFYINTDLDNDAEAVVQSFVRDIKTKEIGMDNLKSINSIMNSIGAFHDYYIPTFNGDRPIEIDTIQGMNVELNDDLMEYLRNAMIAGVGVPPEFLGQLNQAEFARSLAMQNSKFVRSVIVLQKVFSKQFTQLIRNIYVQEFPDDIEDAYKIEVVFPSPSSLNMTNLSEQISNSQGIIEFIVKNTMGSELEENEIANKELTRLIERDFLTMFDWNKYDKLYEEAKMRATEMSLQKDNDEDDLAGDDMGDDF